MKLVSLGRSGGRNLQRPRPLRSHQILRLRLWVRCVRCGHQFALPLRPRRQQRVFAEYDYIYGSESITGAELQGVRTASTTTTRRFARTSSSLGFEHMFHCGFGLMVEAPMTQQILQDHGRQHRPDRQLQPHRIRRPAGDGQLHRLFQGHVDRHPVRPQAADDGDSNSPASTATPRSARAAPTCSLAPIIMARSVRVTTSAISFKPCCRRRWPIRAAIVLGPMSTPRWASPTAASVDRRTRSGFRRCCS